MFVIELDGSRHLLRIAAFSRVTPDDAKDCLERLKALLADVQPGFRLLTDLSSLESMDVSCAPYIGKIMEQCTQKGVRSVVRVMPPEPQRDIGYGILSYFHYGPDVEIITCDNLEEAIPLLEK
jgi:hypothetical protein